MSILNETGTRVFAAISTFAISAVFMATAIAPATQNATQAIGIIA